MLKKKKFTRKKIFFVFVVPLIVVAMIVVAAIFFFNQATTPPTSRTLIDESKVGQDITDIVTVNDEPAGSLIVAPATQKWWDILLQHNSHTGVHEIDFDTISENAQYVAYTNSPGNAYQEQTLIGLPTTFVVYETVEAAESVATNLTTVGNIPFYHVEEYIIFIGEGAYSDINYSVDQFVAAEEQSDGGTLNLNDTALLTFNTASFFSLYTEGTTETTKETIDMTFALLGVTTDTIWSGVSDDGLNWVGKIENINLTSTNVPQAVRDYLATRSYYLDIDGEVKLASEATETNQAGIQYPAQSVLIGTGVMTVRDRDNSVGANEGETPLPPLTASEGLLEVTVVLNDWLSVMKDGDITYPYTPYEKATITVLDSDGTTNITFTPSTETTQ